MKKKNEKQVEVVLKPGQEITPSLLEDIVGPMDMDTGDLGEPESEEIIEIKFRRD